MLRRKIYNCKEKKEIIFFQMINFFPNTQDIYHRNWGTLQGNGFTLLSVISLLLTSEAEEESQNQEKEVKKYGEHLVHDENVSASAHIVPRPFQL